MEDKKGQDIDKRARALAANRERVRRYRAKNNPPSADPKKAPLSTAERVWLCRERKQLAQHSRLAAVEPAIIALPQRRQFPSQERTHQYRQRLRERNENARPTRVSNTEQSRKYYAKKQQLRLKTALEFRARESVDTHSSNLDQDLSTAETPANNQPSLRRQAYRSWPRLSSDLRWFKQEILESAFKRLYKQVKRRAKTHSKHYFGLQLDWNHQLFAFIKLQIKAERLWIKMELARAPTDQITPHRSRKELALRVAHSAGWSKAVAERILLQEVKYIKQGIISTPKQGKHSKVVSWLSDEGTILAMKEYMSQAGEAMDSTGLAAAITNYWSKTYGSPEGNEPPPAQLYTIDGIKRHIKKALSSRSARIWLAKLGWNWKEVRKAVYKDGHERPDVCHYRQNIFLTRLAALHPRMMEWNEDLEPINKELEAGVKPIVFITHDESTFNSNDGRKLISIHEDKSPLRKKGRGQGLHVSDYLTPIGRLGGGEVCQILKCGGDTWWTGEDMLEQLINKAIPAFERSFPGCQGLFAFDNAKSHQKYAADALRTGNMNLTAGGKNTVPMRDGWFVSDDNPGVIQRQSMILPDGRLKGLQMVLQERGLWPQGRKFLTQCSIPGQNPGTTKLNPACKYASNASCCARAILSSQPDFQEQKGELQETVEAAGHLVIFYPVYHCELNFIEYYWGRAKLYARAHCEYTFPALVRIVPEALAQVSDNLIFKYYQRVLRMMEAYRNSLVYGSEDFKRHVFTRYSSHRRIPESALNV